MPDILMNIECKDYISIFKLIAFLVLFYPAIPLVRWIYEDSSELDMNQKGWTAVFFGTFAVSVLVWLVIPIFWVGFPIYLIAVGSVSLYYAKQRNTLVHDCDRVLTLEHIKSLFEKKDNKKKKDESEKYFVFVTANKNEVPKPEPKTPEYYGFKTASELFSDALWRRAEIISLAPTPQNYQVVYQIDGIPSPQPSLDKEQALYLIHFIKNIADLDVEERRKPQKGKFTIKKGKESTEWRCVTAGSTAGEQVQIRLGGYKLMKLDETGMLPEQLEQINSLRGLKQGLFIVSGPKKSGITTSFYAMLKNHDSYLNNITTLEKQPSAELQNVVQNTFSLGGTDTSTYDKKLRTIVRMGPDIVGVAEVEDTDTAKIASDSAKDNKLIYITFESPSLIHSIAKWVKLMGGTAAAYESIIGISCQRLMRRLCDDCKQGYAPNREILRKFNIPEKIKVLYRPGRVQYDKRGRETPCETCQGTGYVGRTGVFEVVIMDQQLKAALASAASPADINNALRSAKVSFIQEQTLKLVINGVTSIEEMVRVLASQKAE
jgi:type II secretory ATPase GspE/PulE/Tfp pilus assembly ATPase PilB-like protein